MNEDPDVPFDEDAPGTLSDGGDLQSDDTSGHSIWDVEDALNNSVPEIVYQIQLLLDTDTRARSWSDRIELRKQLENVATSGLQLLANPWAIDASRFLLERIWYAESLDEEPGFSESIRFDVSLTSEFVQAVNSNRFKVSSPRDLRFIRSMAQRENEDIDNWQGRMFLHFDCVFLFSGFESLIHKLMDNPPEKVGPKPSRVFCWRAFRDHRFAKVVEGFAEVLDHWLEHGFVDHHQGIRSQRLAESQANEKKNAINEGDRIVTTEQLAAAVELTPSSIRRYVRGNVIKPHKEGAPGTTALFRLHESKEKIEEWQRLRRGKTN